MGVFQKIKDFLTGAGFGGVANAPLVVKCNQQPVASNSVIDLVRDNDIEEVERVLSRCSKWEAAGIFMNALECGDRLEVLSLAASAVEECFLLHFSTMDPNSPDFEKGVDISMALVGMGVLDRHTNIGYVLARIYDLAFQECFNERIEPLIVAIIQRRSDLRYTMLLDQLTHSPARHVHSVLRIMRENGCDFSGGIPVACETFLFNNCPGLISDLVEWGVYVDRPSPEYNGKGLCRVVASINSEVDEGERRIAEREATNINTALADAGQTQDDAPKQKRRM